MEQSLIANAPARIRSAAISSRMTAVLISGMMVFCASLAYFFFGPQSLRLDEAQSLWQTTRSAGEILTLVAQDVHVPLYHQVLHFWRMVLGDTVGAARLLSLLFYLLSIPAIYFLGKVAYSRTIGLFAAFLFSISPFMNWYGSEIRMYTLFTFLVIVNQYFFLSIFKNSAGKAQRGIWIGYAATAMLGVYAHYFFFLNLLSQLVFYFIQRDRFPEGSLKRFAVVAALVVAAFAPWVWWVWVQGQAQNQHPLLPIPTTVNLFNTFSQFLLGFQNDSLNTFFLSLWPVTIIFGFLALRKNFRISPVSQYFLLLVLLSITVAFAISFIVPVFVSRYLIFTVPALYLLLASVISSYSSRASTIAGMGITALMLTGLVIQIANPGAPVKENYREAATYISEYATPQDVVVLSAPFTVYPVQYYYRGQAPVATLPMWNQYAYGPIPPFFASLPGRNRQGRRLCAQCVKLRNDRGKRFLRRPDIAKIRRQALCH